MENKEQNAIAETERAFLADLTFQPEKVLALARAYGLAPEKFSDPAAARAWELVDRLKNPDHLKVIRTVCGALGLETVAAQNAFFDLGGSSIAVCDARLREIIVSAYTRAVTSAMAEVRQMTLAQPTPDLGALMTDAIARIPKPEFPDVDLETGTVRTKAEEEASAREEEIPEELLHVPGFIDELVDHSLAVAIRPNRTLSFAAALALLAHLAGRQYTDRRGTRSNLYVVALAPSGGGKEHPRRVNQKVLNAVDYIDTCRDQTGSGEGIEDLLCAKPAALLQMDEIQTTFASLRQSSNSNAQGIYRYLLTFYSASGGDHATRLKASSHGENAGRVIHDPSLTLLGTGVPTGFYQALTQDALENGLAGRCLIFQTNRKNELNEFRNEVPPPLPSRVIQVAAEMAAGTRRPTWMNPSEADLRRVPFAQGVNERFLAVCREADKLGAVCERNMNAAGTALWARTSEKVSKLALLHAVSVNFADPVISSEGVEWAWRLVRTLNERMIERCGLYMTTDRIDGLCSRILVYLSRNGGKARRSDLTHNLRFTADDMDKAERTLLDRAEITADRGSRNCIIYKLLRTRTAKGSER